MLTSLKTFSRQKYGRIVFFLAKLLAFFLLFDYFFLFLIGASVEGGVYIPFLAETLNIPVFYRDAVLLMGRQPSGEKASVMTTDPPTKRNGNV